MYFICKFSNTWTFYDKPQSKSRLVTDPEIDLLQSIFPRLIGNNSNFLEALQVTAVSLGKKQPIKTDPPKESGSKKGVVSALYYICRISNIWVLYDNTVENGRVLGPSEIDFLTTIFPMVTGQVANVIDTLLVAPISLSRLQQLTISSPTPIKSNKSVKPSTKAA